MSASHYFTNAHDWNVGSININYANTSREFDKAFQHLYDNIAIDAVHNSAERHDAPKCHQDTRKAVQREIHSWITDGDEDPEPMKILHLTGPAGTGKTAIAGSIADTCDEEGLLAGSFFFASFVASETRRSKRCLVATLAYHLIFPLDDQHPLRRAVLSAIQRDPSIFRRRLKDQFKFLLVKPFNDTQHQFDISILPKVFIIDGLDEVEATNSRQPGRDPHEVRSENEVDQEEILSALLYASNSSAFPFRVIVASRPERVIETFFQNYGNHATRKVFLDAAYNPDSDIRLFLNAKFAEIRRRYRLPASWPSYEDIQQLVYNASGQFVYAATIVRFLQSGKHPNLQALLDDILKQRAQGGEAVALAPLDALYTRILKSSPDPVLAVQWIYVMQGTTVWADASALFVNQLLQEYEGQADYLLENLTSLIWIPPIEDQSSPYRFHHKSFLDFLGDESRCGQELGSTYSPRAGSEFYMKCCVKILMDKSPAGSLPYSQKNQFLHEFVRRVQTNFIPNMEKRPYAAAGALARCDVAWWVHFMASGKRMPLRPILRWFDGIHRNCPVDSPGDCLPYCKHWRNNILQACEGLGCHVPNAIAFFRESLCKGREDYGRTVIVGWSWDRYFRPRDRQLESSDLPATLTRHTVDEEYQATLDLVAAMHSRLPTDWRSQLEQEVRKDNVGLGRWTWAGFTEVIEEIRRELGIEAPDLGPVV